MHTIFQVRTNELDEKFLDSLKSLYGDKEIEIIISEVDETEYLLKSDANRKRLLEAVANIGAQNNLVEVKAELFQ